LATASGAASFRPTTQTVFNIAFVVTVFIRGKHSFFIIDFLYLLGWASPAARA
jgi:hypothetical protein